MNKENCQKINEVSCSFCLAKWLQVTIDLVHGTTHSCHHPIRHIVPLEELKKDPSALHNTAYKKEQRKQMLEGKRPEECVYCWNIEDNVGTFHSDRFVKSTDPWAFPYLEKVRSHPWQRNINPTYVEVMFDNFCNFSCTYCTADISTSIAREMEKHGPYRVGHKAHRDFDPDWSHRNTEENRGEFKRAFWKWLPELLPDLHVLRVTGGEPLLIPEMEKLLDFIQETPGTEKLQLAINSNLGFSQKILKKYVSKIQTLLNQGKLKSVEFYVSVDTWGEQAEYIRKGLNYRQFSENLEFLLKQLADQRIVIMTAFNILSIPKFDVLLRDVSKWKEINRKLVIDISYVKNPDYLRPHIIEPFWYQKMKDDLTLMEKEFSAYEVDKFKRIVHWVTEGRHDLESLEKSRADFFSFIHEYDRRYQLKFNDLFPELKSLLALGKKSSFNLIGLHPPQNP